MSGIEAIIFIGLQAAGKTTFFHSRFAATHAHVSMDILKIRRRESRRMLELIEKQQPFVIDNTNPSREERAPYIHAAREGGFRIVGYYFESRVELSMARDSNRQRPIGEVGIRSAAARLNRPRFDEGFDELYYVRVVEDAFEVSAWREEEA